MFSTYYWAQGKDIHSYPLIQHQAKGHNQYNRTRRKIKGTSLERRNKTVPIHKRCDSPCRKSQGTYRKSYWNSVGLATLPDTEINTQKSILSPHNENEQLETDIQRNTINYNSIKEHKLFRYKI